MIGENVEGKERERLRCINKGKIKYLAKLRRSMDAELENDYIMTRG